jgi:hypothetical protein
MHYEEPSKTEIEAGLQWLQGRCLEVEFHHIAPAQSNSAPREVVRCPHEIYEYNGGIDALLRSQHNSCLVKPMESTANDGQGPQCDGQEENASAAAASPDSSFAQDSAVSSLSPNNSPERTHDAASPADTGPSLADSPEAAPSPSPPPLRSVGTEENMDMVESLSRVQSTRRTNRAAAAAAAAAAEEGRQGGAVALFHAGGIPPRHMMGRPPLSPAFGAPAQHAGATEDGAEESAATSNSGKCMSPAEISLRQEEASFYGAPANEAGDDNIWGLLSGAMGNVYEW